MSIQYSVHRLNRKWKMGHEEIADYILIHQVPAQKKKNWSGAGDELASSPDSPLKMGVGRREPGNEAWDE